MTTRLHMTAAAALSSTLEPAPAPGSLFHGDGRRHPYMLTLHGPDVGAAGLGEMWTVICARPLTRYLYHQWATANACPLLFCPCKPLMRFSTRCSYWYPVARPVVFVASAAKGVGKPSTPW